MVIKTAITNDWGESFQTIDQEFYPKLYTSEKIIQYNTSFELDNVLFNIYSKHQISNHEYYVYRFQKDYKFIDSSIIFSGFKYIVNLSKIKDNKLIALGFEDTGDSNDSNYAFKYFIMESSDKGYSWDYYTTAFPLYPKNLNLNNPAGIIDVIYFKDKLLIFNDDVYAYDIESRSIDSLNLKIRGNLTVFEVDSTQYIYGNGKIYFKHNIFDNSVPFDSIDASQLFNLGKYKILGSKTESGNVYLLLGKLENEFENSYLINIIKISKRPSTSNDENIEPEDDRIKIDNYVWNSDPYPNPGSGIIKTYIYWSNDLSNAQWDFEVCDYLGIKVKAEADFTYLSKNSGLISIRIAGLRDGTYFVVAKAGKKRHSFKISVK